LWWLGIHGANIIMAVYQPILLTAAAANVEASLAGTALPYTITYAWWFTFTTMFNLAIPLALLIGGKSIRAKTVGKMSVIPAAFCIHEPVFFGLPVVLNPILFIPFTLGFTIQFVFVYIMTKTGLCPVPINTIPWTTPPIIGGLLATNFNIMGAVTQVASIALGVLIYLPFIKVLDKQYLQEEKSEEELALAE
jgi:PTS system cellobiose-specific IIC component